MVQTENTVVRSLLIFKMIYRSFANSSFFCISPKSQINYSQASNFRNDSSRIVSLENTSLRISMLIEILEFLKNLNKARRSWRPLSGWDSWTYFFILKIQKFKFFNFVCFRLRTESIHRTMFSRSFNQLNKSILWVYSI